MSRCWYGTCDKSKTNPELIRVFKSIGVISNNFFLVKGRLLELKKGLFSAPKLCDLLYTEPKSELKTGPF